MSFNPEVHTAAPYQLVDGDDDDDENVSTVGATLLFVVPILNGCDHKCAYMIQRLRCLFPHAHMCTMLTLTFAHVAIKIWQSIGNENKSNGKTVYHTERRATTTTFSGKIK